LSEELKGINELELPVEPKGHKSCWNVYTVRLRGARAGKRNKVVQKIRDKGVGAVIYYPVPIHLIPYYMRIYDCKRGDLPETEKASNQVFSLPVHQSLGKEDLMYIADTLKKILAS
jgi:dTDP-4-amino-4,6-dideoxygalactose transaminase